MLGFGFVTVGGCPFVRGVSVSGDYFFYLRTIRDEDFFKFQIDLLFSSTLFSRSLQRHTNKKIFPVTWGGGHENDSNHQIRLLDSP